MGVKPIKDGYYYITVSDKYYGKTSVINLNTIDKNGIENKISVNIIGEYRDGKMEDLVTGIELNFIDEVPFKLKRESNSNGLLEFNNITKYYYEKPCYLTASYITSSLVCDNLKKLEKYNLIEQYKTQLLSILNNSVLGYEEASKTYEEKIAEFKKKYRKTLS